MDRARPMDPLAHARQWFQLFTLPYQTCYRICSGVSPNAGRDDRPEE